MTVRRFFRPLLVAVFVGLVASTEATAVQAAVLWTAHLMRVPDVASSWAGLGGALALVFFFARNPID